jgi:hypothetical protein
MAEMTRRARRAEILAAILAWALSANGALAESGIVVRAKDGSAPVNQPDLFARALAQAWGDGSRFCAAVKARMSGAIRSCSARPYGETSVFMYGRTPMVNFSDGVTIEGDLPYYKATCPVTEEIKVQLQAPLTISGDMLAISSLAFGPATLTSEKGVQRWGSPCSSSPGQHPEDTLATAVSSAAELAGRDINFPGDSLNRTLAEVEPQLRRALSGATYTISTSTGDIVFAVTGSVAHERPSESPPLRLQKKP